MFRKFLLNQKSLKDLGFSLEELQDDAARVIQNTWRRRVNQDNYVKKKQERKQVILEGYARRIQRIFRLRKQRREHELQRSLALGVVAGDVASDESEEMVTILPPPSPSKLSLTASLSSPRNKKKVAPKF